jgi:hypothetical protein
MDDNTEQLRDRLTALADENRRLTDRLRVLEAEQARTHELVQEVEEQNACLANRFVACDRLHATHEREEVLAAIREIALNLIGAEEMGVFELSSDGDVLCLIDSLGIEAARFNRVPVGRGAIGHTAATGALWLREGAEAPAEDHLTACIPLKIDGRLTGVIALFRLLKHKHALEPLDHQLFGVLATHAAQALYFTRHAP